jgi:DNA-directed RNA polymerase specialized sigma24 family protein
LGSDRRRRGRSPQAVEAPWKIFVMMLNLVASQRRHRRGTGSEKIQSLLEARPSPYPADNALFETEYKRQLFRWAAERVSGEFRGTTWAAFWETGVEGKKAQVVADTLGMGIGAVSMAKSRGARSPPGYLPRSGRALAVLGGQLRVLFA